jgi:cytosine/adenosine deaminase-related metal-dependent hydrolase
MRYLTANRIHPVTSPVLTNHALVLEDDGTIVDLLPASSLDPALLEFFDGDLIPGFVNTHCHLELSHLKGRFPEKKGLPDFLFRVVDEREADEEAIQAAMRLADQQMEAAGIVAVGDICNQSDSFQIKAASNLFYHSFIELLAFNPLRAHKVLESGNQLLQQLMESGLYGSIVAHAPYSVSQALLFLITRQCAAQDVPTSIHMMESNDENEFFMQGTGLYHRLYSRMNMDIDFFEPEGKTALSALLPYLYPATRTLLVHNTIATASDVQEAIALHPQLYWCFCPNANQYIESRLPDIPQLMSAIPEGRITLGTDSLASNHQLSILAEMTTIRETFPQISFETILEWATINGARFLGIDNQFGSFEAGKRPGVILSSGSSIQRII